MFKSPVLPALAALCLSTSAAIADAPEIVSASTETVGVGWRISVTLQHSDDGFDHYADAWRIETTDGDILGVRELMHPHSTEPFTRSLPSVVVPDGVDIIYVRAHCSVDGWSETRYKLDLNAN